MPLPESTQRIERLYQGIYTDIGVRVPLAILTKLVVAVSLRSLADGPHERFRDLCKLAGINQSGVSQYIHENLGELQEWLLACGGSELRGWLDQDQRP